MAATTQQQPTPPNAARPPRYTVQHAAALIGWSDRQLYRWLCNARAIYKDPITQCYLPFRKYQSAGLFEVEPYSYINETTQIKHHKAKTYITSKGFDWIKRNIYQAASA